MNEYTYKLETFVTVWADSLEEANDLMWEQVKGDGVESFDADLMYVVEGDGE